MKKGKLKDFVTFTPGINPTRAQRQYGEQNINYYDGQSFDADYHYEDGQVDNNSESSEHSSLSLKEGDVIISNSLQLATIVSKNNAGKVLSLNFTKIEFNDNGLDKWYFLYLFNVHSDIKKQKWGKLQGSGQILRLPIRELEQISIPIIPIDAQKRIGIIYSEVLNLKSKLNTYADLMEQFVEVMLEDSLKEGETK